MTARLLGLVLAAWAGAGVAAASPEVRFARLEGSRAPALTDAQRRRVTRLLQAALDRLARLTGLAAKPVRVVVFRQTWEFVQRTGLPQHIGGVTFRGTILLQPLEVLDRHGVLDRIVTHEAVHHFFYGRDWPDAFQEALAHRFSGGSAVRSARAGALEAGRPDAAAELEWLDHLAWELACAIEPDGEKTFFRKLLAGGIDLAVFAGPTVPAPVP